MNATAAAGELRSLLGRADDYAARGDVRAATSFYQAALKQALVEDMGIKPRLAFGPVRTAVSGRRVSPPLFESMVILGKESSLRRLRAFRG